MPLALFYGGVIEVIQPFVGRSGEIADLYADGIGLLIGAVLGVLLHYAFGRHRRKR